MSIFSKMWGSFSGKTNAEKAESIYKEIEETYRTKSKEIENTIEELNNDIKEQIQLVNKHKECIKSDLFVRTKNIISKIKGIKMPDDFTADSFDKINIAPLVIRDRKDVLKITSEYYKSAGGVFKTIFTLGIGTRKKAKESLYAANEERAALLDQIARVEAEIQRSKLILNSIQNVEHYFASVIKLYRDFLYKGEGVVDYLVFQSMQFAHKLLKDKLSISVLPTEYIKELEILISSTFILKNMVEYQLKISSVSDTIKEVDEESENIKDYAENIKIQSEELNKKLKVA